MRLRELRQLLYKSGEKGCLACLRGNIHRTMHTCVRRPEEMEREEAELLSEVLALITNRDFEKLTYELSQLIQRKITRQAATHQTVNHVPDATKPDMVNPSQATRTQIPLPDTS